MLVTCVLVPCVLLCCSCCSCCTPTRCPANWKPYDTAAGRTLVPGYPAISGTSKSLSAPLSSMEDRKHAHTFATTVSTDSVSFAGIDGCCNENVAASGTYPAQGAADDGSSNLPYIQLLTCISMFETFAVNVPDDALLWNPLTGCPKVRTRRQVAAARCL